MRGANLQRSKVNWEQKCVDDFWPSETRGDLAKGILGENEGRDQKREVKIQVWLYRDGDR